jgi:trehalose 6-phosphate synthase
MRSGGGWRTWRGRREEKQDLARLIVVSNRVPVPTAKGSTASAGGLAVALEAALKAHGGLWFGWSGKTSSEREIEWLEIRDFGNVTYAVADLNRRDVDEYYAGFANRALWPLCHYRLDLTDFSRKDMAGYFRVNRSFARLLAPLIRPTDLIWVHDYHLIPLASELRHIFIIFRGHRPTCCPRFLFMRRSCGALQPTISSGSRPTTTSRTSPAA